MKVDEQLKCKDCDWYGKCEYYHNRKETSQICKMFNNTWIFIAELEKIKQEVVKMSYDCEIATVDRYKIEKLLDNHISKLKGENNVNNS